MRKGVLALVLFGLLVAVGISSMVDNPDTTAVAIEEDEPTRTDPYNLLTDYRDTQFSGTWDLFDYENPWNQQWHNWSTYRQFEKYDNTEFWFRCKNMTEDYQWLDDVNATTNGDEVGLMKEDINLTQTQDDPMNFTYPRSDKKLTAKYYEEMNNIGVINLTINPLGLNPNPFTWTNPKLGADKELNVEVWVDTNGDYDFEDPDPMAGIEGMMRFDFNWWDTPYDPADPGGTIEPYVTVAREKNSPTFRQMEEYADGIGYWLDIDDDGHPNVPGDINGGRIWVLIWRSDNEPDDLDNRTMDLIMYCGYTEKLSWISLPYLHPQQLPVAKNGDPDNEDPDMGFPENKEDWLDDPDYVNPIFNEEYPQIKEGEIITFDAHRSYDPQDDVGADGIGYGAPEWTGPDTGEGNENIDDGFPEGEDDLGETDTLKYKWEAKVAVPGLAQEQTVRISGGWSPSPIYDWQVKLPTMPSDLPAEDQYLILNVTLTVVDRDLNQGTFDFKVLAYKSQNAPRVTLSVVPQLPVEYAKRGEAWALPNMNVRFDGYAFDPDPNSVLFFEWDFYGPFNQYYHFEGTPSYDFTFEEPGEWNITLTVYDGEKDNVNTLSGNATVWLHVVDNQDPVPVIRASHNPAMNNYHLGHINSTKNKMIYFNGSFSYDPDIWVENVKDKEDFWSGLPGWDEDGDDEKDFDLKYQWDWGDGTRTESFTSTPQAEYKWQDRGAVQVGKQYWPVTLRVWDGRTTIESDPAFMVYINLPPRAEAGPNQPAPGEEIEEGMEVTFDGRGSYDPNDDPNYDNKRGSDYTDNLIYTWDFGDGSATETGAVITHEYQKSGTFTVMLTVSDGEFSDTDTLKVKIVKANQPPIGKVEITSESWLDIDNREVFTNTKMTFDASQSYDPDGSAYLDDKIETSPLDDLFFLTWDLGDGTISKQAKIDHIYEDNGTFEVSIYMEDAKGLNWSESYVIEVTNRAPIAVSTDISLNYEFSQQPVLLNGEGSYDTDGEVIGYYWDFGDGTHSDTSQGINGYLPSKVTAHTYEKTGLYKAKLYVMDNDGTISETPHEIDINIKADPSPPGPDGIPFGIGAAIGGAIAFVAVLALASTFFIRMRKRL